MSRDFFNRQHDEHSPHFVLTWRYLTTRNACTPRKGPTNAAEVVLFQPSESRVYSFILYSATKRAFTSSVTRDLSRAILPTYTRLSSNPSAAFLPELIHFDFWSLLGP